MREDDDDHVRRYAPLLRRIIILVAVLTAVPVILWTITAFVRSYVGPPKVPTFHQLAATATLEAPENANASTDASRRPSPASEQAKLSDPSSLTVEARVAAMDARDGSAAPKGPFLSDHSPDGDANIPASALKIANTSAATAANAKAAEMPAAPALATPDGAAPNIGALAAQQPAISIRAPAETSPAAEPLAGPIPLPRHRPHDVAMAQMGVLQTSVPQMSVPMPRPRPDSAGPTAPPEMTTTGPLDFLQNLFH
jgi:hypothetical protein